jgi:NADP-dependent 3-hydroxy acid dehydrogenase YdfG
MVDDARRLHGAVAVVTGASSGIGLAVANALADEGAKVVAVGRDRAALQALADAVGGSALVCDVREPDAAQRVLDHALTTYGRVDVLVANAGVGWAGDTWRMPPERLRELVDVNVAAPLALASACLPAMLERGSGQLVFVSSIAGALGVPGEAVYSATKAAVEMFADVLRAEVHGTGVRVATVLPGVVRTAFFERRGLPYDRKFPRPMPPERIARDVVGLLLEGGERVIRPRWLWLPIRIRSAAPRLYRALERRFG